MRITALAGDKAVYSKRITLSAAVLSSTKTTGQTRMKRQSPCRIRTKRQQTSSVTARRRAFPLRSDDDEKQSWRCTAKRLEQHFANVWDVMRGGIERGITTEGVLPGKLARTASCGGSAAPYAVGTDKNDHRPNGRGGLDQHVRRR